MRYALIAAACGLAAAAPAPAPQDIDFDLIDSLPNPTYTIASAATAQVVSYDAAAILSSAAAQITSSVADVGPSASADAAQKLKMKKRQATTTANTAACTSPQPTGAGPMPTADTASAFLANPVYAQSASAAPTPSGYTNTFTNLQGSNNAYGYMGFTTLQSYDTNGCAAKCNAIVGCMAFNIYFERDPTYNPGTGCTNPPSTTNIKCVFWGGPVNAQNAVNMGQWRNQFQVVIAGSNGYESNAIEPLPGYSQPNFLGNAAINAPLDKFGANTFLGSALFTNGPFNASLCAAACSQKSAYAVAHPPTDGSPVQTCQFFNTYLLYENSATNYQGQYCAMYSESWSNAYASNPGQYRGNNYFGVELSYTYSNSTNPGSACAPCAVAQASQAITYSSLQPYCSTLLGYTTPVTTATATSTYTPSTTVTVTVPSSTSTVTTYTATTTTYSIPQGPAKRDLSAARAPSVEKRSVGPRPLPASLTSSALARRAAQTTPAALTQYPSNIVTSACSENAVPVTTTSTTTTTMTVTAMTTTSTSTSSVGVTTVTINGGTTTVAGTLCASAPAFAIQLGNSGTAADGQLALNGEDDGLPLTFNYDPNAGNPGVLQFNIDSNGLLRSENFYIGIGPQSAPELENTLGENGQPTVACSFQDPTSSNVIICQEQGNPSVAHVGLLDSNEGYYFMQLESGSSSAPTLTAVC